MNSSASMSSVKLGFSIAWPALWTGFPIKAIIILILLAMGLHPWEDGALAALLILSIPIDIWALGLVGRTVFAERLRAEVPGALGIELWWRAAVLSAVYLPIAYLIETQTVALGHAAAEGVVNLLKAVSPELGIAEKIAIELVTWGGAATVMAALLLLGWLFTFGKLVGSLVARSGRSVTAGYQELIRQLDEARIPGDQGLMLTVFTLTGVGLVLLFWFFMPVITPHPHELYEKKPVKVEPPLKPVEALQKTEKVIGQAEAAIQALEAKAEEESKMKGKGKDKSKDKGTAKETAKPKAEGVKADKGGTNSRKADAHADGGRKS